MGREKSQSASCCLFGSIKCGKSWGDKNWHVYKPSKVRMLDMSNQDDASVYQMAQKLQAEAFKGATQPKYEKVDSAKEDIA